MSGRELALHHQSIREFENLKPNIAASAWVDTTAVVIGDVTLGEDVSVWPQTVIRGDINAIAIGAKTNIQDGSVLHVSHDSANMPGGAPLIVGEQVTVGHKVILHGCQIADHCLIGMGAIIMDKVQIGAETIIGAGSLVAPGKVLEGGYLWVGSPARRVRALTDKEKAYLRYSAAHYVSLKNRY